MAIKRSPLGRDPLEWIKVTKNNALEETQGTAADRLTKPGSPTPEATKPAEETLTPAEKPPAQQAIPPAVETPITVTTSTAATEPQTAEQQFKETVEIPLFTKIEEEEKKAKPSEETLEVTKPTEPLAPKPPLEAAELPKGGHSVNFLAPGLGVTEKVEVPLEKAKVAEPAVPDEPLAPPISLKKEEVTGPESSKPERVHVGAVDLRVERRPIPPVRPATAQETKMEQRLSFASVLMYICMLLLAVLVLSAFFINKNQVSKLRSELRGLESKIQQQLPPSHLQPPGGRPARR